jgi:hypothetical protein
MHLPGSHEDSERSSTRPAPRRFQETRVIAAKETQQKVGLMAAFLFPVIPL